MRSLFDRQSREEPHRDGLAQPRIECLELLERGIEVQQHLRGRSPTV
jgi:hypothetical protein